MRLNRSSIGIAAGLATSLIATDTLAQTQRPPVIDAAVFVGAEEAGISRSATLGTYLLGISLSVPVTGIEKGTRAIPQIGAWLDASVAGVPSKTDWYALSVAGPVNDGVTRGLDVLAGLDVRLGHRQARIDRRYRVTSSVTFSLGLTAPFSSSRTAVFELNDEARELLGVPASAQSAYRFVAISPLDSAVNFQWYVGWRLKALRFAAERASTPVNFPASLDVQVGQHELLRGSKPLIYRLRGRASLPVSGLGEVIYFHAQIAGPLGGGKRQSVPLVPAKVDDIRPGELYLIEADRNVRGRHMFSIGVTFELLGLLKRL